jgi:hypothetical protein
MRIEELRKQRVELVAQARAIVDDCIACRFAGVPWSSEQLLANQSKLEEIQAQVRALNDKIDAAFEESRKGTPISVN